MKFLHSMIRVKNIEASLKFYVDFMGLKVSKVSELEDCKLYFLEDESNISMFTNFFGAEGAIFEMVLGMSLQPSSEVVSD